MGNNVIVSDNKINRGELDATLTIPIGASHTPQVSGWNTENASRGVNCDNRDEFVAMVTVSGTMPAGSEIVLTPIYLKGSGTDYLTGDAQTTILGTVTDDTLITRISGVDYLRDADYLQITYRFQQAGSTYDVTSILSQLKKKDDSSLVSGSVPSQIKYVSADTDFPAPVGGVITLVHNTRYVLVNDVSTVHRFEIPASAAVTIESNVLGGATLTTTNSGTMFTSTALSNFLTIQHMFFSCPNGTLFDIDGNKDEYSRVFIFDAGAANCSSLGTITDVSFTFDVGAFFDCGQGIVFDNCHEVMISGIRLQNWKNQTSTMLSFNNAISNVVLRGISASLNANETLFDIDASSTTGGAIVSGCSVNSGSGTIFATGSKNQSDLYWIFIGNVNLQDSTVTAMVDIDGNALTTSIPANDAYVLVNANTWSSYLTERVSVDSNGVATYTGIEQSKIDVTTPHAVEPDTGVNKDITVMIGNIHAHSTRVVTFTNGTNLVNETATERSNGDIISFYNNAGTLPAELREDVFYYVVNKLTDSFQLSYTQGGAAIAFTDDGTPTNSYSVAELIGFEAKTNTDAGAPINTTSVGISEVETGDQICALVSCADATDINVTGGGSKIRKA